MIIKGDAVVSDGEVSVPHFLTWLLYMDWSCVLIYEPKTLHNILLTIPPIIKTNNNNNNNNNIRKMNGKIISCFVKKIYN